MEDTVKTRRNPLAWFGKHKKLTALLLVVLIAAVLVLRAVLGGKKAAGSTYQFVRTSTLQKTSLTDSVSVNGTVKSGYEASVTVADSAKLYKVSEVKVAVGDTVKKGDVIATLDTSDLEKQIESAEESYGDTLKSAQTSYDRATADLETSTVQHENSLIDLQAKIDQADQNLQDAKDALTKAQENERKAQSTYDTAVSDYNTLKSAYDSASASISAYTQEKNDAATALNNALYAANQALSAQLADPDNDEKRQAAEDAQAKVTDAQNTYNEADQKLTEAQNSCSAPSLGLYGFTSIQTALTQADSTKTQAESALDSAKNAVDTANTQISTCEQQVKAAHDSYDQEKNYSNLLNKSQNVEDSATKLEQAQRTPDNLETLRSTLEDCTLTATMDGTITALNATVGSVCSGTVATIQNTDALVVDVTIPANSVPKLSTGMTCHITSDATGDAVIDGTLTQNDAPQPVSPVPETKKPLIEMHGIRKSYYIGRPNELEILHGIDLTVYPGEFVAIVGESGSGKSTLMNIIGVLDKPTAGEYALDGVNIHDAKDNQLADIRNRKIGFVFQTYNLIGRQSALKNVELPMLYAGVPGGERTRRAKEWLERVGMGERMKHQPNELSGGQKQRVAIARAMVNEPALILADEPTGALDSQTSRTVMDLFHEMHNTYHKTIVLITHNPELADECERVLTLRDGLIVGERKGSGKRAAL